MAAASLDHLGVLLRIVQVAADLREGLLIDHRAHEVAEVADVAHPDFLHHGHHAVADVCPSRPGHIHAAGRRALLALVFEGAAHRGHRHLLRIGRGVHDDEVLAAGFADEARIVAVTRDVVAHSPPHALEDGRAASEMNAPERRGVEQRIRDLHGIARHEVDDTRRQAGRLEQLQHVVRAQHGGGRRLPYHGVAHQRGGAGQVAADGGEVERRDGVHEPLERAVLHLVPHGVAAVGLLGHQLLGKRDVEAPEIHEGPAGPLPARGQGGVDGLAGMVGRPFVVGGQHVRVLVGHHGLAERTRAHLLAADHQRDVHRLGGHQREARLDLVALAAARSVGEVGLVLGSRNTTAAGE